MKTVFINEGTSVSLNVYTLTFLQEALRGGACEPGDVALLDKLFKTIDEFGYDFVSLEELSAREFKRVRDVATAQYEKYLSGEAVGADRKRVDDAKLRVFREIIDALNADSRSQQ